MGKIFIVASVLSLSTDGSRTFTEISDCRALFSAIARTMRAHVLKTVRPDTGKGLAPKGYRAAEVISVCHTSIIVWETPIL